MSDIAIRVENLSKRYRIGRREKYLTLSEVLTRSFTAPFRFFRRNEHSSDTNHQSQDNYIWALKDVSFEVKRGEVVGIIGRNGAGKSTLLKILARITDPTEGYAEVRGRVGSLLEVGTGFHPELTGRENIYLSGAVLGMKKKEIDKKFDEIVAFAELEKFIDTPVKHYSTGMHVRLAFAVAAHLDPEILLVDEVLAVGDAAFQRKCLGKMEDVAKEGRTVLFVSHNMAAVASLCSKAILLESGKLTKEGEVSKVIENYISSLSMLSENLTVRQRQDRKGSGRVRITDVYLIDQDGRRVREVFSGQKVCFVIEYESSNTLTSPMFEIIICSHSGQPLLHCDNEISGNQFQMLPPIGSVQCCLKRLPLSPGLYRVNVGVESCGEVMDRVSDAFVFQVIEGDFYGTGRLPRSSGICLVDYTWRVTNI